MSYPILSNGHSAFKPTITDIEAVNIPLGMLNYGGSGTLGVANTACAQTICMEGLPGTSLGPLKRNRPGPLSYKNRERESGEADRR